MRKRWIRIQVRMGLLVTAILAVGACTDIAFGGGGDSDGGTTAGGSFTGWSAEEVTAAFGHQGVPSGGTIDIGGSPPPSIGAHQGTQWTGFNKIPSGLPQFTKRQWAQANVNVGTAEAQKQLEKEKELQTGENVAQGISIGCSVINGILSLGATTLTTEATKLIATKIAIYGLTYDGLTAAVGAYTESHLKGESASKSLATASSNGAAKVLSTVLLGKLGPANKAGTAVAQTVGGILYDAIGGSSGEASNLVPASPVVSVPAPIGTPATVPVPVHQNM